MKTRIKTIRNGIIYNTLKLKRKTKLFFDKITGRQRRLFNEWKRQISGRGTQIKKKFLVILLLVLSVMGIFLVIGHQIYKEYTYNKEMKEKITLEITSLKLYESRGSRDDERIEKYAFTKGQPIQMVFTYEEAQEGTVVYVEVIKDETLLRDFEIPLESDGEQYITLSTSGSLLEKGDYEIRVSQSGYTLQEVEFKVE